MGALSDNISFKSMLIDTVVSANFSYPHSRYYSFSVVGYQVITTIKDSKAHIALAEGDSITQRKLPFWGHLYCHNSTTE
jgi:hypothetical protein